MISSEYQTFAAGMRTLCLQNALTMAKAYQRWNKAHYKDEMDYYYTQAKWWEGRKTAVQSKTYE